MNGNVISAVLKNICKYLSIKILHIDRNCLKDSELNVKRTLDPILMLFNATE